MKQTTPSKLAKPLLQLSLACIACLPVFTVTLAEDAEPQVVLSEPNNATYLNPRPEYPVESIRLKETGTVILNVLVSPSGEASDVVIAQSSKHPRLDETALAAVKK